MSDQSKPNSRPFQAGLLLCTAVAAGAVSCGYQPGHAPVTWGLSEMTLQKFEEGNAHPSAAAHLEGALGLFYGDAEDPRYLQTDVMINEEFYPNDGGSAEVSEDVLAIIVADNRSKRFERQLELIAEDRFDDVPKPLYAQDLWDAWMTEFAPLHSPDAVEVLAAGVAAEEGEEAAGPIDPDSPHPEPYYATEDNMLFLGEYPEAPTWRDEANALFTTWYPTMRESGEMYRQQCLHCHGAEGGGDGPTAPYLVPRPRDYRQGKFKRVSVDRNGRPTRGDLHIILEQGIYGSAMPNFGRFTRGELEGLVDYVRLLSMRGETEGMVADATVDSDNGDVPLGEVQDAYALVWERWNAAPDKVIVVPDDIPRPADMTLERLEHGRELFNGTVANCYTCHGTDGRGNGESAWEEVAIVDEEGNDTTELRRRLDEWGNDTLPRNFRLGEYRFGGRPADVFRRIKVGISGTIMPAADPALTDDDIWDLVYYVRTISTEYDIARLTERKDAEIRARHAAEHGHGEEHGDDGHDGSGHDADDGHDESGEHVGGEHK